MCSSPGLWASSASTTTRRADRPLPRAVVTGGAGFLGSHLCARLLGEGWDVVCFDSLLTGNADNLVSIIEHPHFRFINYDVTNYMYVDGAVDWVMHLASPASPV